mgnify:CR=1 FL=1
MYKEEKELKKLPRGPRKYEVVDMFPDQSEQDLRHEMNCIIRKHRGIPETTQVKKQTLRHPEFVELIKTYGWPAGYEKFFRD